MLITVAFSEWLAWVFQTCITSSLSLTQILTPTISSSAFKITKLHKDYAVESFAAKKDCRVKNIHLPLSTQLDNCSPMAATSNSFQTRFWKSVMELFVYTRIKCYHNELKYKVTYWIKLWTFQLPVTTMHVGRIFPKIQMAQLITNYNYSSRLKALQLNLSNFTTKACSHFSLDDNCICFQ